MVKMDQLAGMNIHYLFYSLEDFCRYQQEAGIRSIELWGGSPHFYMDAFSYSSCREVRKTAGSYGLKIIAFTPESIIYPYNVASPEAMQREKSRAYFKNAVRATAELGTRLMTINSGYGLMEEDREESWKRSREMLRYLAEEAEKEGVAIAMESLRPEESRIVTTLADAKRMLAEVDHPALQAMIDTTAVGVAGETLTEWFEAFGNKVKHIHFIDGRPDGHLAWGDGSFDLAGYLDVLDEYGYQGYLGQEITDGKYFEQPYLADRQVAAKLTEALSRRG